LLLNISNNLSTKKCLYRVTIDPVWVT